MKTIFIFPILFLVFGVSEHQTAEVDDCDDNEITPGPYFKSTKHQLYHNQRKNDISSLKPPHQLRTRDVPYQFQRPQQDGQQKKYFLQSVRKAFKLNNLSPPQTQRRRPSPAMRSFNRRHQTPMMWAAKSKPMNILIKPVKPIILEPAVKRQNSDFYPTYKKQKRMKIIPAYDEYEEPEYVHEVVYPPEPRAINYMEVEDPPSLNAPCDHNEDYKDHSAETDNNLDINPREMDNNSEDKDDETPITKNTETAKEEEVTTPAPSVFDAAADNDQKSNINSTPVESTNVMELLLRGLLAVISYMKSKTPISDDIITNILDAAIKTCNSNKA